MKKAREGNGADDPAGEMLAEYAFDYEKARPNRFAPKIEDGSLIVILEPDIARVFRTPDSVKNVLRALIATMPEPPRD
jgi:hypothetical protein